MYRAPVANIAFTLRNAAGFARDLLCDRRRARPLALRGGRGRARARFAAHAGGVSRSSSRRLLKRGESGPLRGPFIHRKDQAVSGGAAVRTYLAELRSIVAAVEATNDLAFGATGQRMREAVDVLDRATTWLLSKIDREPQPGRSAKNSRDR